MALPLTRFENIRVRSRELDTYGVLLHEIGGFPIRNMEKAIQGVLF